MSHRGRSLPRQDKVEVGELVAEMPRTNSRVTLHSVEEKDRVEERIRELNRLQRPED